MKRLIAVALVLLGTSAFGTYYKTPYFPYHENCSHFFAELEVGAYRLNAPQFSFGELTTPVIGPAGGVGFAPIPELAFDHDQVNAFYPKLTLGLEFNRPFCPCWIRNFLFEVGFFYITHERADTPGDGVWPGFSLPSLAGTDFIFSDELTEFSGVDLRRQYHYGGIEFKLGSDLNLSHSNRLTVTPFFEVDVNYLSQDYKVNIGSLVDVGTDDILATNFFLNESLRTNYYDFGVGLEVSWPLTPCCKTLVLFGEAVGFVSAAHTRLNGDESALFALLPPTPLNSGIFREQDNIAAKVRGQFGVGYQFGYNVMASIIAQVDWWGYIPYVVNPHRVGGGDVGVFDRPAHIESKSTTNYALVFSLVATFF